MEFNVNFIFRASTKKRKSIEKLFYGLLEKSIVDERVNVTTSEVPGKNSSLSDIYKNLKFVYSIKNKHSIQHVTGDINYVILALKSNSILTIHDIESSFSKNYLKNFFIWIFWYALPCLKANKITVISNSTLANLKRIVPFVKKSKFQLIENFVAEDFKFKERKFNHNMPNIFCFDRKPNKNLKNTILALHKEKCRLIIIGEISSENRNLLSSKKICFKNYEVVSDNKYIQLLDSSDILCFPSFYEGFGIPIIEAQALGIPVITSNISGMKEVAENQSALLVNPKSILQIRQAFLKIKANQEYREELIEKGKINSQKYNIDKIYSKYINVYRAVP